MKTKKKLRGLRIKEFSGVDKPAQEGALALIMKRADMDDDNDTKRNQSPGGDDSNPRKNKEEPMATKNAPAATKADEQPVEKSEDAAVKALETQVETLTKSLDEAKAWGALTDAEKAFAKGLDDDAKAAFILKGDSDRAKAIEKASASDPVIYTATDGTEFRKSDDERIVNMAKRADAAEKLAKSEIEKRERLDLEKRAESETGNYPGTASELAALVKAVDGIEDEGAREIVKRAIKAGNDALGKAQVEPGGFSKTAADAGSPMAKIEEMAKAKAVADGITYEKAFASVLVTQEGRELYKQHNDERAA